MAKEKIIHTPNFVVAGAAKCGTTSLYHYLKLHPNVYMSPIKETNHFSQDIRPENFSDEYKMYERSKKLDIEKFVNSDMTSDQWGGYVLNRDHYLKLFRFANNKKAIGEISNSYLYSEVAAENIHRDFPNMKIIMILRQPADRAYSHYLANLRDGRTTLSFKEEVLYDDAKARKGWSISHLYFELGLYADHVQKYFDLFSSHQIRVYLFDDLIKDNQLVTQDLFEFLALENIASHAFQEKHNEAKIPKNPGLIKLITQTGIKRKIFRSLPMSWRSNVKNFFFRTGKVPTMSMEDRKWMTERYVEDIKKLEKIIKRDLSNWIS
jgi:hypothetical protein